MYAMFIQFLPIIVVLVGVAIGFIIALAISFWVFRDAKKRGIENPLLWAVVVFFTGIIGLIIYFFFIRPKKETVPPPPP
ncbi:MAG: hypothetical protein DRJ37_00460 [Thermoprotei archaeon]|nr:MAG: hypothetical protein DRJ37_00460 [Thermoprotei archaeon]